MEYEEGDLVICTVDRIIGTTVFVKLSDQTEGSISFSEIAPGRIRNIRDYVVPKKKIVCKILRIRNGNIELTFRRVGQEEAKKKFEEIRLEKSYVGILKSILGKDFSKTYEQIQKEGSLYDLIEESRENPKLLEKYLSKKDADKVTSILEAQKPRKSILKKKIYLTTKNPEGIKLIKNFLNEFKDIKIRYISAGNYSVEIEDQNPKEAGHKLKKIFLDMEKLAKKKNMEFRIKEK